MVGTERIQKREAMNSLFAFNGRSAIHVQTKKMDRTASGRKGYGPVGTLRG
jgi:hypothetical protein